MSLKEMLDGCTSPDTPQWEKAWKVFFQRYKTFIRSVVYNKCYRWDAPRLGFQFQETVDDIIIEIYSKLCRNDYRVLKKFKNIHSQHKFKAYLALISARTTNHRLAKLFIDQMLETPPEELPEMIKTDQPYEDWELYDSVVQFIRDHASDRKQHTERDILIFMLYIWGGLDSKAILNQPVFKDTGHRVLDNVINRTRSLLRNNLKIG